MGKILCATRGGEASHDAQDAAIALARERGDELIFLYVADISFLNQMAAPMVVDVEARLEKMGRFQLAMAQERAAAQGVSAGALVRRGQLRAELSAAAKEISAVLVMLGHPGAREAVFDEEAIQALAAALEQETGTEVRIV
jgi:nucleotide-binding universal stress UspA family protein